MSQTLESMQKDSKKFFESIYDTHKDHTASIPWARHEPNPHLIEFLQEHPRLKGRAAVIGCGLGDDAAALAAFGFETVAFDISQTAIELCRQRFGDSPAAFVQADLFDYPFDWKEHFDFIFESHTIQSLPLALRDKTITAIADLLKPGGIVLTVARGKNEGEQFDGPPWPLTINELKLFTMKSCKELGFSILASDDAKSSLLFKAHFQKER